MSFPSLDEIVCSKCGESNPPASVICSACWTSFRATSNTGSTSGQPRMVASLICPRCGEGNPSRAWMCRACDLPFRAAPKASPKFWKAHLRVERDEIAPLLVLGALISSGWWPRRLRFPVVLAALTPFAFELMQQKLRERQQQADAQRLNSEEHPIIRIAKTILCYAHQDGASQIRLRFQGKSVEVHYFVDEAWRDQMRVPAYAWPDLRAEFIKGARQGQVLALTDLIFDDPTIEKVSGEFRFTVRLDVEPKRETLLVTFLAPDEEVTPDENGSARNAS